LKRFKPKSWKKALEGQQKTFEIAKGWIEDKENEIKSLVENNEMPELPDFLTHMLVSGKLTLKEITMNALDLLTAGIETTSTTLSWALYELAINPDSQDKLRSEVKRVVSNDELITPEHIHNMPYLRWCIKETLRLYSVAIVNLRRTTEDVVLSGYHIPAGNTVFVVMSEMVKSAENYSEPDKFMPERWDREGGSNIDSFTNIQFGFGPRMCVGRRVAELELHIALADIIRKYSSIEFPDDKPMEGVIGIVLTMERDFNLKLVK
jgi:cytochrome P450